MSITRFHLESSLSPSALVDVLTDFSPQRPLTWPSIDAEHFEVHGRGENWAEVTEGTAAAWERARYEWNGTEVRITTLDSKVFGPGGGWLFQFTPSQSGTRVDVELTREPIGFTRKMLASLLPLIGPGSLRKSFAGPLRIQN
jgi:hypothetical protein